MNFSKSKALCLIEVLLAWGIIALFLSGFIWVQVEFIQKNKMAHQKEIAFWQLEAMAERLKANQTVESRSRELFLWNLQNKILLKNSRGDIHCFNNDCEIRLSWGKGQSVQLWV